MSSAPVPATPPAPASPPAASAPTAAQTSLTCSRFLVQIEGLAATAITQVIGIETDLAVVQTREGSDLSSAQKLPGQVSYPDIVLQRPLTRDLTLWNWMQQAISGAASQHNVSISLLDGQENPVIVWQFRNAFPVRWAGPALNALSNDLAIETLELAYTGLTMTTP